MGVIVFAVFFIAVIGVLVYSIVAKHKREQAMAAYVAQQGWTALGNNISDLSQYLPSYLLNRGQNPTFDMAYRATVDGTTLNFFQYCYTEYRQDYDPQTHTAQQRAQQYYFTVVQAPLAHPQPTVVLLHHTLLGKFADIGEHSGLTRLTLEGDFNKDFDTYMTPNGQVETLSLLTPDIMQLLQAGNTKASLSIGGQSLSMSVETSNLSPKTIMPLLQYVAAVVKKADAKPAPMQQAAPITTGEPSAL